METDHSSLNEFALQMLPKEDPGKKVCDRLLEAVSSLQNMAKRSSEYFNLKGKGYQRSRDPRNNVKEFFEG